MGLHAAFHAALRVAIGFALVTLFWLPGPARAQSAQLMLTGVPSVLESPYMADVERAYFAGRFPLRFVFLNPSGSAEAFRFRLTVEYDGATVLEVLSNPVTFSPGVYVYQTLRDTPEITFPNGYRGLLAALPADLRDRIVQTGRLPEGSYFLTLEAVPEDPEALIVTGPAMATFDARLAEPPVLLSPADGDAVDVDLPVFSWTSATNVPVGTTVTYDLRIAELLPGQTPLDALEANQPHVNTTLTGITTFAYTMAELPLEVGARYAWRIRARDAASTLPFGDEGETEVFTFVYKQPAELEWRYPTLDPFIVFTIPDAVAVSGGLLVDGTYEGTISGDIGEAEFVNALFDQDTGALLEGTIVLGGATVSAD